jgi:hypothetical protein
VAALVEAGAANDSLSNTLTGVATALEVAAALDTPVGTTPNASALVNEVAAANDSNVGINTPSPQVISLTAVQNFALTGSAVTATVTVGTMYANALAAATTGGPLALGSVYSGGISADATVYYRSSLSAVVPQAQYFASAVPAAIASAVLTDGRAYAKVASTGASASVNAGQIFFQATVYYPSAQPSDSYVAAA